MGIECDSPFTLPLHPHSLKLQIKKGTRDQHLMKRQFDLEHPPFLLPWRDFALRAFCPILNKVA